MIILYIFLISTFVAKAETVQSLTIEGQKIEFVEFKNLRLLISKNCLMKNKLSCEAYRYFEQASHASITQISPPEIGKELCKKFLGEVVLGKNSTGDQMAICKFKKDSSFIDNGSLYSSHFKLAP